MNAFIVAALAAGMIFLSGCDSSTNSHHSYVPPSQPVQPIEPAPIPDPEPGVPNVGTGSVNYQPSCEAGFATVTYIYRNDTNIDQNSFVIVHSVNGARQDIISGSVFNNGSISKMQEEIYIASNDTDRPLAHQLRVDFIADGVSQVNAFSFLQPACEVVIPVEPEPDPTEPVEPTPPPMDIPMYAASTSYNIGDYVRVDRGSIISTFRCIQAYTSGAGGGWATMRTELVNWRWVKDELPAQVISIEPNKI